LAETAEPLLYTAEQIVWLDRLESEHDNFRAALAWSLETPDGRLESGLRLVTALVGFWIMRSHYKEGRRWLELALAKRLHVTLPFQARLLLNAGWFWYEHWESDPTALLQESLNLYRQLDDKKGTAWTLSWLGSYALSSDDLDAATSLLSQSLKQAGEVDDKPLLIKVYGNLTYLAMVKGDYGQVTEQAARGMALIRVTGDRRMKYHLLVTLGRSARRQHDYAGAAAFFYEALALVRELKNRLQEGYVWNDLGEAARVQRAYEQAAVFYRESLTVFQELDYRAGIATELSNLGLISLGQGDWLQARALFKESLTLSQNDTWDIPLWNVWGLAGVALAEGRPQPAAQLLAAARPIVELGHMHPVDRDDYERDITLARAQLGEEAFTAAWAAGQAMSLEQAIALALEEVESETITKERPEGSQLSQSS
jgi:tetratricopeptide (TPR) repeat protein